MRIFPRLRVVWVCLGLLMLCSCATEKSARSGLPADVKMNKDAGRGGLLIVKLRLEDGEELPFAVDTGSPWTLFDKSLESRLGKKVDTATFWNFGAKQEMGIHAIPKLYLGKTELMMSGPYTGTYDPGLFASKAQLPVKGILGMDCLEHYCIQLDFSAGKMRFIDSERANKKNWGKPFPLTDSGDGCCIIAENLAGIKGVSSIIDTGCDASGWLTPNVFQQWTNQATLPTNGMVCSPRGVLGEEKYSEVELGGLDAKSLSEHDSHTKFNGIGLHFLSQHLVTLDFPNRTMYLKRTSDFALEDKALEKAARKAGNEAYLCAKGLKKKEQLPGLAKAVELKKTMIFHFKISGLITIELSKKGDSDIYHYEFSRTSKDEPWILHKAWRTDREDRVVEEYAVKVDGR